MCKENVGNASTPGGLELRILSSTDVAKLGLTVKRCIEIIESALVEQATRPVQTDQGTFLRTASDTVVQAMLGLSQQSGMCGVKYMSSSTSNSSLGLPINSGMIMLNSPTTGLPKAVIDTTWIAGVRTAAGIALGVKHLARLDSSVIGVSSTSPLCLYSVLATSLVLPNLKEVRAVDSFDQQSMRFHEAVQRSLPHVSVTLCADGEQAIGEADVVITGSHTQPFFDFTTLKPGVTVFPLKPTVLLRYMNHFDKICSDNASGLLRQIRGLPTQPSAPVVDLAQIVCGHQPGRQSEFERVLHFTVGLSTLDVAVAAEALLLAEEQGIGVVLPFLSHNAPIPFAPLQ